MRQRGPNEPLAMMDLTKGDKDLVGTTPKNIRELIKKNREAYNDFKTKGLNRKVKRME